MMNEASDPGADFNLIASNYIDRFAGGAKALVDVSSPFVEEIAVAVRSFRDASGDTSRDRRETQSEGQDFGSTAFGALVHKVKRQPLASLLVVGALAAAGYYIVRAGRD